MANTPAGASDPEAADPRPRNLALLFEELFTAIVRLRAGRQEVANADLFRNQVLHGLKIADQNAKSSDYADEDVRLAVFAVVAFLDESILNLHKPVFQDWIRKPLQEQLFGRHVAGEVFFQHLDRILGRRDAPEVADLLEVYYICLLLGYLGRFSIASKGDLHALMGQTEDKIQRIRKSTADFSPQWRLPADSAPLAGPDPWMRRLLVGLGAVVLSTLILFGVYKLTLAGSISELQQLAAQGGR